MAQWVYRGSDSHLVLMRGRFKPLSGYRWGWQMFYVIDVWPWCLGLSDRDVDMIGHLLFATLLALWSMIWWWESFLLWRGAPRISIHGKCCLDFRRFWRRACGCPLCLQKHYKQLPSELAGSPGCFRHPSLSRDIHPSILRWDDRHILVYRLIREICTSSSSFNNKVLEFPPRVFHP